MADHRLISADGHTEVELSFWSEGLLAGIVSALFANTIREYVATEARNLKQVCESG